VRGDIRLAGGRWALGPARFTSPVAVLETWHVDEAAELLAEAEKAARAGRWVVGCVSYQAAPGFDARLRVPGNPRHPLVWFGVYNDALGDVADPAARFRMGRSAALMGRVEHSAKVEAIRQSIVQGDTYQVNLTFPIEYQFEGSPEALFSAMLSSQPKSYGAHLDMGRAHVVSVSPELFVAKQGRRVTARPMKGTAPRGRHPAEDLGRARDLAASEKERAGNVMIVDLLRNDLGRVAEFGSVEASTLFEPERHPTVWQLTSTISATLTPGTGLVELFRAAFPSGSVTGAPKVSTMGIIAQLEAVARDVYCGAIGYIAPDGENAEFSVAIRTGVVAGRRFTYHVGGGITYDSLASSEFDECMWKALVVARPHHVPDLVETMRFEPFAGIPLLTHHIARLTASADYWGIPCDLGAVGEALSAVESSKPARVRLVLHKDGGLDLSIEGLVDLDEPVALTFSDRRVDQSDPMWFHKTDDRRRYPITEDGHEEVLVNQDGKATETNLSNLMVRIGDRWVTPPVESGCLPGVYRAAMLSDGTVTERPLTPDDLRAADELAVTNAVRGWRKAVLIE
jgi:para-aminobenzoate synthetase / 4-amino-4-deoxychorismate lyase